MKIYSVYDNEFREYGRILTGYDVQALANTLAEKTPLPDGVEYVASEPELEKLTVAKQISDNAFGGMPVQLGWCNGHNTKLNCLEYHKDSEIVLGTEDFILLLAKQSDIENGVLDTSKIKAFSCPKNILAEVFSTSLHYAPCSATKGNGFKVMIALPKNTNVGKPEISILNSEDSLLWATNKWLLAHKDSAEASQGAYVGLSGINIDIEDLI
jgi:hypothetical protein